MDSAVSVIGTAVLVGPCALQSRTVISSGTAGLATTALACLDDEFALVDEQPVAVASLWREVFSSVLDGRAAAVLIYPSWWSDRRIAIVSDAAHCSVPAIELACRSAMLASVCTHRPSVVVEIADLFVVLSRRFDERPVRAVSRAAEPPAVADEVAREVASLCGCGGTVVVDCAAGVAGAPKLGELITGRLEEHGLAVTVVDDDRLLDAVREINAEDNRQAADDEPRLRPTRMWALVGGLAAAGALTVAVMVAGVPTPQRSPTTLLVEGRVVVEVPSTWTARRITAGPGSARLQVTSPTDVHAALHVTQSPVPPGETLPRTADNLRRAVLAEQPGVFVDFNPEDSRGGRPAVTYREVRDGHDIQWTVLLAGALRISIGCQSARGSEDAVRSACERAIASAHELTGTVGPQRQSNTT